MSAIIFSVDAAMAQLVEHILGKDEVPSSNLGSSSNRSTPSGVLLCFWSCYPIRTALGEVAPCSPLLSGWALFVADFSTRLRRIRFDFLPEGQPLGSRFENEAHLSVHEEGCRATHEVGLAPYEACLRHTERLVCASLHASEASASWKPHGFRFMFAQRTLH